MIPARDVTPPVRLPLCCIYVVAEYRDGSKDWEVEYSFTARCNAEDYVRSHETPERCRVFECRERRAR